ncbi:MAG: GrpB family protein [Chloroflexi bacterium]|nr:GrpB family protein [Chloroflexota bacterium]
MPEPESVTAATDDLAVAPASDAPETPPIVAAHNPAWPHLFAQARAQILQAVGPHIQTIHHVGSTSVPGLAAKPIIDILVGVHDWNAARVTIPPLQRIGWEFRGPRGIPRRHYFVIRLPDGSRTHHLHMLELNSTHYTNMLAFRNHLQTHPTAATQYATLKHRLASRPGAYQQAKAPFIQRILGDLRR